MASSRDLRGIKDKGPVVALVARSGGQLKRQNLAPPPRSGRPTRTAKFCSKRLLSRGEFTRKDSEGTRSVSCKFLGGLLRCFTGEVGDMATRCYFRTDLPHSKWRRDMPLKTQ
jgi:hypothetical protein